MRSFSSEAKKAFVGATPISGCLLSSGFFPVSIDRLLDCLQSIFLPFRLKEMPETALSLEIFRHGAPMALHVRVHHPPMHGLLQGKDPGLDG
jgi:hypothetical protein